MGVQKGSANSVCEASSAFVASGSWQTPTAAASLKLTSQRDGAHAKAPASMVPSFTAGANVPFRAIAALSHASVNLRTLSRLTQRRQTLCSVSSRASCTWTRDDVKASRHPLVYKPYRQCGIRPASLFSTSTTRRLKLEDEVPNFSASRSSTEVSAHFFSPTTAYVPLMFEDDMSPPKSDVYFELTYVHSIRK